MLWYDQLYIFIKIKNIFIMLSVTASFLGISCGSNMALCIYLRIHFVF